MTNGAHVNRSTRVVLLTLAFIVGVAALEAIVRAQGPGSGWVLEAVKDVPLDPGCGTNVVLAGFAIDPQDRPVVGWREESRCSGHVVPWWSRKDAGHWQPTLFEPGLRYLGGGDSDAHHTLALAPDGTPFMMFSAIDTRSGDNNFFTFVSNLNATPTGSAATPLEFEVYNGCDNSTHVMGFAAAGALHWMTTLNLCGLWSSGIWVDGNRITPNLFYVETADFAVGLDGRRHGIWSMGDSTLLYTDGGSAGHPIPLIQAQTGQPYPVNTLRDAQIAVDAGGTIHAVVRGLDANSGYDLGSVGYLTSSDNGTTWSPIEIVDASRQAQGLDLVLDRAGAPAIAYLTYDGVYLTRRVGGVWAAELVRPFVWPQATSAPRLAFDTAGAPSIAFYDPAGQRVVVAHPAPPIDTTSHAPSCSAAAPTTAELWPPKQQLVPIGITGVSGSGGHAATIRVTEIRQDEPTNSEDDGATAIDGFGLGTGTALVRAERDGPGDGRVYHIFFTATDAKGASCTGVVKVGVPHDQSKGRKVVDGGPLYDSTVATPGASGSRK